MPQSLRRGKGPWASGNSTSLPTTASRGAKSKGPVVEDGSPMLTARTLSKLSIGRPLMTRRNGAGMEANSHPVTIGNWACTAFSAGRQRATIIQSRKGKKRKSSRRRRQESCHGRASIQNQATSSTILKTRGCQNFKMMRMRDASSSDSPASSFDEAETLVKTRMILIAAHLKRQATTRSSLGIQSSVMGDAAAESVCGAYTILLRWRWTAIACAQTYNESHTSNFEIYNTCDNRLRYA